MTLFLSLFALTLLVGVIIAVVIFVRHTATQNDPYRWCTCGMTPRHAPDMAICRAVNEKAGREVTPNGFVLSRDKSLVFDGMEWVPNPHYKPRLDAENFEPRPYGRGANE